MSANPNHNILSYAHGLPFHFEIMFDVSTSCEKHCCAIDDEIMAFQRMQLRYPGDTHLHDVFLRFKLGSFHCPFIQCIAYNHLCYHTAF